MRGSCAQKHGVPRIQARPNALPDRLLPQKLEKAYCLHHCEASFHQLEPTLSHRSSAVRLFQALPRLCPEPQLGLRGAFPTVPVAFYFFPKCCLCVLGHKKSSPLSLAAFIIQRTFAFLTFIWLLNSRCLAHFFVVLVQILPFAAFCSFVDCLAKKHVNQRQPTTLRLTRSKAFARSKAKTKAP